MTRDCWGPRGPVVRVVGNHETLRDVAEFYGCPSTTSRSPRTPRRPPRPSCWGHEDPVATLQAKGQDVERRVLAQAVRWHTEHRVLLNGHRTVVFA